MATYNDGTVPSGATPGTVTINAVSYIAESWSFTEPSNVIERTDADDVPNAAKYSSQKITGTATLQLATTSTALPDLFEEFTISYRGADKDFVITQVDPGSAKNAISSVNITFAEILNPAP